ITEDPLADILALSAHLPDFTLTGHYTQENYDVINENHSEDFLWPEEQKLMHYFMMLQKAVFA
ncbi:uncharacterized protein BT62DRAFT_904941, partial [Guyanagaster necrorhizus]